MKKRSCAILSILCLLSALCGCDGGVDVSADPSTLVSETGVIETAVPDALPTPELSQREQDWIEDFDYLKEQLLKNHPAPFFLCSEEEFDWRLDQLSAKIDQLTDSGIYFELSAIIAGLGDNHTSIEQPDLLYDSLFPVTVWYFGEKLYLCSYIADYEQFVPYLLHEIVAVNGVDITYLRNKHASMTTPSNSWGSKEHFMLYPAFVDWASGGHPEHYTFQILNDDREVVSVEVPAIPREDYEAAFSSGAMVYPEHLFAPYWNRENRAEYLEGENGGCIYMAFADMERWSRALVQELFEQAAELMEAHPECDKLVIDLRANPGGSVSVRDLVQEFLPMLDAPSIEQTYVLTGGTTASAAIGLISIFQDGLGAVTVGEPTCQFPSFFCYKYIPTVFLPHSRLKVNMPTNWWDGTEMQMQDAPSEQLYEWQNTVLPDVFVYQDIEDIRQGKDSAIQWVLAR